MRLRWQAGLGFFLGAVIAASPALAQGSASAYTYATRYDPERRVVGTIAPDPDGAGPLKHGAVRNTYDAEGRLWKVESGELSGWQSEFVLPSAWTGFTIYRQVENLYDADGRKIRETVSGRDPADNVMKVQGVTQFNHDGLGQVRCQAVRMNPATWSSLPSDACAQSTPAGSFGPDRITRTTYLSAGRPTKIERAVGTPLQQDYVAYTYDASLVTSVTDANGAKATYEYDTLLRRKRWYFPSKVTAGQASTTDYEDYGYDLAGNRTSLRKRDGVVIGFTYDALNRMTVKSYTAASPASPAVLPQSVYYGYDNRGLQLWARYGSTSGQGVETAYDALGRPGSSSVTLDGVTRTLTYQYDANGNRTRVTHPDTTYIAYAADGLDRPLDVKLNGGTTIAAYVYDVQGRRASQSRGGGTSVSYTYDAASRVATMTDNLAGTNGDVAYAFSYNPASQIVGRTRSNDAYVFDQEVNVSRGYLVNGLNQYTNAGALTLAYDANGSLTSDGNLALTYDAENRLVAASGARTAALKYDPMGRLYETSGGSAGVTRFLYDGDELVAEYDASGTLIRRYAHGPGVDDPLVWYEGATTSVPTYLSTDHQGSISAQADGSGNLVTINAYNEWGIPRTTNRGRFGYTGQAWLPELRMWHYKARIYSPTLGRFLQTDPVGYDDQINLYAYVGNDPLNNTDPSGEEGEDIVVKGRRIKEAVISIATAPLIPRIHVDLPASIVSIGRAFGVSEACLESTSVEDCSTSEQVAAASTLIPGGLILKGGAVATQGGVILGRATLGRGMYGLGSASPRVANLLGRLWVGKGARLMSSGKGLVSADGLRQFRFPSMKPRQGTIQANFESRAVPTGRWINNGHLNIK